MKLHFCLRLNGTVPYCICNITSVSLQRSVLLRKLLIVGLKNDQCGPVMYQCKNKLNTTREELPKMIARLVIIDFQATLQLIRQYIRNVT